MTDAPTPIHPERKASRMNPTILTDLSPSGANPLSFPGTPRVQEDRRKALVRELGRFQREQLARAERAGAIASALSDPEALARGDDTIRKLLNEALRIEDNKCCVGAPGEAVHPAVLNLIGAPGDFVADQVLRAGRNISAVLVQGKRTERHVDAKLSKRGRAAAALPANVISMDEYRLRRNSPLDESLGSSSEIDRGMAFLDSEIEKAQALGLC